MSKIEWTDETWNPIVGCSRVSAGCDHCYAERMAARIKAAQPGSQYREVTLCGKWNGNTEFIESALLKPLRWKKPRMVFVCSMSDLFHEDTPFEWIDRVFDVIANCPHHTFQVLTKRPMRMLEYFGTWKMFPNLNLPNVWLGVSAESQEWVDKRIPILLRVPGAAVRFVSVEPMIGPVSLRWAKWHDYSDRSPGAIHDHLDGARDLDWVICGCESGPGRRPMEKNWAASLIQQCEEAGIAFFMKQLMVGGAVVKDVDEFPPMYRVREFPKGRVYER